MNIKEFLNELNFENAIELIKTDITNNIYHFYHNSKHYSLARIDGWWELMDWSTLQIIEYYKSNFDVIYNLYNDI